jgi:hypothetical protein
MIPFVRGQVVRQLHPMSLGFVVSSVFRGGVTRGRAGALVVVLARVWVDSYECSEEEGEAEDDEVVIASCPWVHRGLHGGLSPKISW